MDLFYTLCILFFLGGTFGFVLETLYRHFVHRKWIKPGFLHGPVLPLYGFGLIGLFLLSSITLPIPNQILQKTVLILILTITMILLEYITGLIFIKRLKVKLWDYSMLWGNIQGIICPLFSFFWAIIASAYVLFLHPHLVSLINFLLPHTEFIFPLGIFYGILIIDINVSFGTVEKIKKWAKENQIVVKYEILKEEVSKRRKMFKEKINYFSPFKTKDLAEELENYLTQQKEFETKRKQFLEDKKLKKELKRRQNQDKKKA